MTLRQAGATTRLVPAAITWWNPRQTLPGYLTDRFRTARAEGRAQVDTTVNPAQPGRLRGELLAVIAFRRSAIADRAGSGGGPPRPVRPPGLGHPGGHPGSIAHPAGNDVRRRPGCRCGDPGRSSDRPRGEPAPTLTGPLPARRSAGDPPAGWRSRGNRSTTLRRCRRPRNRRHLATGRQRQSPRPAGERDPIIGKTLGDDDHHRRDS